MGNDALGRGSRLGRIPRLGQIPRFGRINGISRLTAAAATASLAAGLASAGTTTIHVDASAPPGGTGETWAAAFRDLDAALASAASGGPGDATEIRIAEGRYVPDAQGLPGFEVSAPADTRLALLGGFPAGGGDPADRNPDLYPTELSGDVNGDDSTIFAPQEGVFFFNIADNRQRVLTLTGAGTVALEGLTIEGGHGSNDGGGILVQSAGCELTDLVVRSCSANSGGGVRAANASRAMRIEDCTIERCAAGNGGGALIEREAEIRNTLFQENNADTEGGLRLFGDARLTGCRFERNVASLFRGAFGFYGDETLAEGCEFVGNSADSFAGAGRAENRSAFRGCLFSANSAGNDAGALEITFRGVVEDCEFVLNRAERSFGAVSGGGAALFGCLFERNSAGVAAGAGNAGRFDDCRFVENSALAGGAVFANSDALITGCEFRENTAQRGGAITGDPGDNQGGVGRGSATIRRSLFVANHAETGGGAIDRVTLTADSCVFIANTAGLVGGAIDDCAGAAQNLTIAGNDAFVAGGVAGLLPLELTASILWDNTDRTGVAELAQATGQGVRVSNSIVMGLATLAGDGNLSTHPEFADPVGDDGVAWSGDEDLRLASISPAIDAGGIAAPSPIGLDFPLDRAGLNRFVAFAGGPERLADMGAFETQDCDADGTADDEALRAGAADDCNADGIPDACGSTLDLGQLASRAQPLLPTSDGFDTDGQRFIASHEGRFVVYARSGDRWVYESALPRPNDISTADFEGAAAIEGDLAVAGLTRINATLIYRRVAGVWTLDERLPLPTDEPYSGAEFVDVSGNRVLTARSRIRVYEHDNGAWTNITTAPSATFLWEDAGRAILSGDRIVTSRWTYEYQQPSGWVRQTRLTNPTTGDELTTIGSAINHDWLAIGDPIDSDGTGAVFVYRRSEHDWVDPVRLDPEFPVQGRFGDYLALAGDRLVVGAPIAELPGAPNGYIEIFEFRNNAWQRGLRLSEPGAERGNFVEGLQAGGETAVFLIDEDRNADDPLDFTLVSIPLTPLDADANGTIDSCEQPCNAADLADPFQTLDLRDLTLFVSAFTAGDPPADLAPPVGVFDIADISAFVSAFVGGCE